MDSKYNFEFEHKTLDKIEGEPNAKSLQKLFKQLRRNARSITISLGGGQHGHLFMVLSEAEWNALPDSAPVIPPADPGTFTLIGRPIAAEIAMRQQEHDNEKKRYNKFQALKRTLRNQLVAAIEPAYLDPIRCPVTDMINESIPDIMKFLQDTYGKMTVNQIEEAVTTIKNFTYDPTTSINILLTAVQNHADLLKIAGAEMKDSQIQYLAYYLIGKYHIFKDALTSWNKFTGNKTWATMKEHMRKEYQLLKDVNALTVQDSMLNATDIVNELKHQQESLLHSVEKRFKHNLTEVMNLAITDLEGKDEAQEKVNNTAEINALKLEVKKLYSQLQNSQGQQRYQSQSTYNNNQNNFNRFQPQNRFSRKNYSRQYYCWTHGAGHSGRVCKNPADGHQPEATFSNRMGGNNYGCYNTKPRRFTTRQQNFNNSNLNGQENPTNANQK